MFFLKKTLLWGAFVALMYYGGQGTQSDSSMVQGMGFTGIIIALAILYILFRVMWTAMSFFVKLIIYGCILAFILYSVGAFNSEGTTRKFVSELFSSNTGSSSEVDKSDKIAMNSYDDYEEEEQADVEDDEVGVSGHVDINPMDYPSIKGIPHVVAGNVLKINRTYIKLLGIDAPDVKQTCSNRRGQAYACGKQSVYRLQDIVDGREIVCNIVGKVVKHRTTGVCFLDKTDIGAKMVSSGWAVAYTRNTDVYVAYEEQAKSKRRGLWSGKFYRPADWRKLQRRSAEINASKSSSDSWFNFNGWF